MNALQATDRGDIFYAIRSRVKSAKKIINKVERKRKEGKPNYEPENARDIVGIRVVTLFREDVIEALRIFLRLIRHERPYLNSPFVRNKLEEAIIYAATPVGDPEAIISRLNSVFQTAGIRSESKQVETGYSSIHLVAFCSVQIDNAVSDVPVEIQIRTVFEDAWGEIDHKLRYSVKRDPRKDAAVLLSWEPHLNVLKMFADGCGQYAGIIKRQAIDSENSVNYYSERFVPVESVEDALKQMHQLPDVVREMFERAYETQKQALALPKGDEDRKTKLLQAGSEFDAIERNAQTVQFADAKCGRAVHYFAVMERAFCLLSAGDKASLDEAISIYVDVQRQFPNSAVVYYRHAVALAELDEIEAADAKFAEAERVLERDTDLPEDHWLRRVLYRQRGFVQWLLSMRCPTTLEGTTARLSLLLGAFRCTLKSLGLTKPGGKGFLSSHNNLLYYAVEYRGYLRQGDQAEITDADLKRYIPVLEEHVDVRTAGKQDVFRLDTLCRAYIYTGEIPKAVSFAERVEHLLSDDPGGNEGTLGGSLVAEVGKADGAGAVRPAGAAKPSYYDITRRLGDQELAMLEHALWVLRKYGPGPERTG